MNAKFQNKNWLKIIESARELDTPAEGPHPVDDDLLLNRWSMGRLTREEHQELIKHLANCSECRKTVASMIKTGALELPEPAETVSTVETVSTPLRNKLQTTGRSSPILKMVLSLAAVVLLGVMLFQWGRPHGSVDSQIAQLEKQLNHGEVQSVYDESRTMLSGKVTPAERTRLQKLITLSGIQLAEEALIHKNYATVFKIEMQLADFDVDSSVLANLKMQATRGFPQPVLLAQLDRLDRDFGFGLDGFIVTKNVPPDFHSDKAAIKLNKEYLAEIGNHPNSIDLKLNYGQFLLSHLELDAALKQFDVVLSQKPDNIPALMGIGLAYFKMNRYDEAAVTFQDVIKANPDLLSAKINLAITWQAAEQPEKATPLWKEIQETTTDNKLKQQIEGLLKRLTH